MARGFESKSVEAQQEEAQQEEAQRPRNQAPTLSPEEQARMQQRKVTELALATKRTELASATSDGHRAYLERAIRALETILDS